MATQSISTIKIVYCYAHEDDALREQLARHLSPLRRLKYITGWFNRDIQAGTDWEQESQTRLDAADVILLLISADFFASDYCYTVEMRRALEKHKARTAYVIPILLRPVEWETTPISELSVLPTDKKPITQWADQDKAWLNVVQGIREIVGGLLSKQPLSLEDTDILYPERGPLSGQTVGNKYLLGELIGEGAFSQVYKARHLHLQRQQAIKVLLERHFRKQEFRDRFLREARTVASLDHPYIIHLDDYWVEASQAYLVMPFISGGTLQDILEKQQGFLVGDRIVFYLESICAALDYAHEQGIVHLDLKPLNFLVRADGRLLLSDFGLAHLMKQGAIKGGSSLRVGTPHYMAPEHIRGSPERRSDLFSLGVILYQMLLGRLPFDGLPHDTVILNNITEWPPAPRSLRTELSQEVEDMLARALAKQPEKRYQTANEFLVAFKNALMLDPHAKREQHLPDQRFPGAELGNGRDKKEAEQARLPEAAPIRTIANSFNGTLIGGRYEIREHIATGSMASVFKTWDHRTESLVAIKVLRSLDKNDLRVIERFRREARVVAALAHPNVVTAFDFLEEAGQYFLVMEYIPGPTLKQLIAQRRQLHSFETLEIASQVCAGLQVVHNRGFIHRNIKPQHIMLISSSTSIDRSEGASNLLVKLIGFGIVRIAEDAGLTNSGIVLGTPDYMSPEQARGEKLDPSSDLYSLGAVMFEMLAGRPPFVGPTAVSLAMQQASTYPPPLRQFNANLPPSLEKLVNQAMEKEPEDRFHSAAEMQQALRQAAKHQYT